MAMQILRTGGRMVLPSSGLLYELRKLERSAAIASLDFERYAPAILAKYAAKTAVTFPDYAAAISAAFICSTGKHH